MNYIVDVLTGSKNQKIVQNHHDTIKTHGAGKEYPKSQWQSFIRELIRSGYVRLDGDEYPVLRLNDKSRDVLLHNAQVSLTKPEEPLLIRKEKDKRDEEYDQILFDLLRILRKAIADQEEVPPYVIFHDTSLKEMSIYYPQSLLDFRKISGVGEQKLQKYGEIFLKEIGDYCKQYNVQSKPISHKDPEPRLKPSKTLTTQATLELCRQGLTIGEIAKKRELTKTTVVSHLERLILEGEEVSLDSFIPPERQLYIRNALEEQGAEFLSPVKEKLGEGYSYAEIRLVRAKWAFTSGDSLPGI